MLQVENEEGEEVCEYYMKWRNLPYSEVNKVIYLSILFELNYTPFQEFLK